MRMDQKMEKDVIVALNAGSSSLLQLCILLRGHDLKIVTSERFAVIH